MSVKFRESPMFRETLAKHKDKIGTKLEDFIKTKSVDPMAPFGGRDRHFQGGGPLTHSGFIHVHLGRDVQLLYKRHGKNPTMIDLYAIVTHDELGTGQPANLKLQKNMVKKMDSQQF